MFISVDETFRRICEEILASGLSEREWAERESSDWFQDGPYCGGFEAIEKAFCFSYHTADGTEYWFQVTPDEVEQVSQGVLTRILVREAT
jgi:hypothetical protein